MSADQQGSPGLHANVQMMLAASQRLLETAEHIDSRYRSTHDGVDELLGRSWKGIAPEVHRELWADWDEGFSAVQTALKGMASKIADAARNFHNTDNG